MSRISATFSISLPPKMAADIERVRRRELRSRSELVREALRRYLRAADADNVKQRAGKLHQVAANADEIAAIEIGSRELAEGQFVTLKQLGHELDRRRQQPHTKKSAARARR
jgi:metal-responsive CopG/Arc/MetJ family transcriptional regulator